jgi:hypothetical protein
MNVCIQDDKSKFITGQNERASEEYTQNTTAVTVTKLAVLRVQAVRSL